MSPPRNPAGRPAPPLAPLAAAMLFGAIVAGGIAWRLQVKSLEQAIAEKQRALKQLVLSGEIAPTQAVMDYLTERGAALEQQHARWIAWVSASVPDGATADPQLYFQEQLHDLQRTLDRLAAARGLASPELLGFPKELPPTDTVPRLLVQLALIRDATELILAQGVASLGSCKVEDPQPIRDEEDAQPFLLRLPVRIRLSATLPALTKLLGALQHAKPIIGVQGLRMTAGGPDETLDVELVLSRYLALVTDPGRPAEVAPPVGVRGLPAARPAPQATR